MKQVAVAMNHKERFVSPELMNKRQPARVRKTRRPVTVTATWDPAELEAAESWGLDDFSDLLPKGSF